ncbi:MAG: CBS domain-containing protein [Lachnospiraceae bacterium]|nr:CBS domain-containing protein [Lachnospiraceae bacterium]MBR0435258.1 CBS domain-containing protein [Lachnospiraceae bacterium]
MNILFFLTPKVEVKCIDASSTVRQALEKLQASGYTALPIINKRGKYVGTISEGDLLWFIKAHPEMNLFDTEDVSLKCVERRRDNKPVSINEDIDSLWEKIIAQNFVPVIDDDNIFIGIVTRKAVVSHLAKECKDK